MTFDIRLAECVIRIHANHDYIKEYCKDYLITKKDNQTAVIPSGMDGEVPESVHTGFEVAVSEADISYEREKSGQEDLKAGIPIRHFSDDYLETLAVYRKIAERMLDYSILLYHASVIAVDGVGYLFTAKSGTGKSTHTRLWREHFGDRAVMVNDDKPLLRITEDGVIAYGTPWDGKHRLSTNIAVPLKAICILERSADNHIEGCTKAEAYPMLLQQAYRPTVPDRPELMAKTLKLVDALAGKAELYRLGCNMEPEAAKVAYEGMQGIYEWL